MVKRKPYEGSDQVEADLMAQLDADFAQTIRDLHDGLSSSSGSPVYTGFLASSWKVRRSPINQTDKREDFEPWASIKKSHDLPTGGEGWKAAGSKPSDPVIEPRFPVGTSYKFRNANLFIGNTAEYAGYASENSVISEFVQGEAGTIIKDNMREKGKIFIGAKPSGGFGKSKPGSGLRYIEPD